MLYTASEIARYFIWRTNLDEEYGENITNLRLQKLLYYAQGFSLALRGVPLFDEPIEAWAHGPAVRSLYSAYSAYGAQPLPTPEGVDPDKFDSETRELLEEVYSVYGQFSAWGLRNLTHEEAPWQDTPLSDEIPQQTMREFFATHTWAAV
jgi:uncharacterized phage-associated protein